MLQRAHAQQPNVFLDLGRLNRSRCVLRRNHHLDELAVEDHGEDVHIYRLIEGDDAPERRDGVGRERAFVGFAGIVRYGNATGVSMLDDHARALIEHLDALQRRVCVCYIVI